MKGGTGRLSGSRWALLVFSIVVLGGLASLAWGEMPAPSVHWGSLSFPDQYSHSDCRIDPQLVYTGGWLWGEG
jgi:hypothetical protein